MGKFDGYTKFGEQHRPDSAQSMYTKDNHYEGNMGKNITPGKSYEPSHAMNKDTGDIEGAGITGGKC